MSMNQFDMLSQNELLAVDGGVDWQSIGAGLGIVATACFAIACAPASAFVGVAYAGMVIASATSGAAAGCYIGYGLTA